MSNISCPYCNSARSMLIGNVYCSRQKTAMTDLSTGTLFIKTKKLEETADHVSRLSIRCSLNGLQHYKVDGNDFLVKPDNYLVVNQGQRYRTSFVADYEQEMILVAFQPGFAESLFRCLTADDDQLLTDPFHTAPDKVYFFEKTYEQDATISFLFSRLRDLIHAAEEVKSACDIEGIYTALLTRLFEIQKGVVAEAGRLKGQRLPTRLELSRRLYIARDFMEAHLSKRILLEDAARAACLSVHHFKREFKALFGCSPHRFLFKRRTERAMVLLKTTSLPVEEVCFLSGFENASSFIRQFKGYTNCTPGAYRKHTPG